MDIIVIFNGLGNQMSQYAFFLKKKSMCPKTEFITFCSDHNGLELESVFNIDCRITIKKHLLYLIFRLLLTEKFKVILFPIKFFLKLIGCKLIRENFNYKFNDGFLKFNSGLNFYIGGWHSEQYFSSECKRIVENFNFHNPKLDTKNEEILDLIFNTNSVSFHVRRGDFLTVDNIELFGEICNIEYYNCAIAEIEKYIDMPHYFVFSNDLDWVKSNIKFSNVTFVEGNKGSNSWIDLYLMTKCKSNIIANSSFSWWGAWLNQNLNKIVICPSKFSIIDINSDVYPNGWIKIDSI